MPQPVQLTYFTDVLCIWAYVAQARLDEIKHVFGSDVAVDYRFVSIFGDTRTKLETGWKDRGGVDGYADHIRGIAQRLPHVAVAPRVWTQTRPASSTGVHLFLAATFLSEQARHPGLRVPPAFESAIWAMRRGFFSQGLDVGRWDTQVALARPFDIDIADVESRIHDGTAFALLAAHQQEADRLRVEGSPTFVLNEGRQKLYGNVGFRIIEANIREVLREPDPETASWC